jgi:single-strand DNA-binding protein
MNKLCAIGRLGADPEVKTTRGGLSILELRIAIDARTKRAEEWVTLTTWCRASLFGRRAEALADKLRKGERVGISGALSVREYEKNDGTKGYSVEILDADITLLGSGGERGAPRERKPAASSDYAVFGGDDFADDDIPF